MRSSLLHSIAVLGLLAIGAACTSNLLQPGEPLPSPDAWAITPPTLTLHTGDTARVRIDLFRAGKTLDVRSPHRGGVRVLLPAFVQLQHVHLIGITDGTTPYYVYQLEGIQPGTDSLPFGYGEPGQCEDPPECFIQPWVELLPEKPVLVTVQ